MASKIIIGIFLLFSLHGSAQDSTGNFTVKGNIQVWQQLLDALDKSKAPHDLVVELNKFIVDQIQKQIKKPEAVKKEGRKE